MTVSCFYWPLQMILIIGWMIGLLEWPWYKILAPLILWVISRLIAVAIHFYLMKTDVGYRFKHHADRYLIGLGYKKR